MKRAFSLVTFMVLNTAAFAAEPRLPAFPGAQGPGADATGGRGGDVYHVTSLSDDPELQGTLRHGVKTAPDTGRIIVFDVAGTIRLQPPGRAGWLVVDKSNLTIAGQTAPWPGITIVGQTSKWTGRNVILRNLHFRPGKDQKAPGQATNDGISCYLQDSIVDHCSVSWADDEQISSTDAARNHTVQYCIMAEGLNYKGHSYGSLISSDHSNAKISYHHNLYAHLKSRLPRLGSERGTGVILNFSNNIIYDWAGQAGYSANDVNSRKPLPNRTNFIGNYYILGPSNAPDDASFNGANAETVIYQQGNYLDRNRNGKLDGADAGWNLFSKTFTKAQRPFDVESGFVQSAPDAFEYVLSHAGAFWWKRDPVDARIVEQVRTQSGKMIKELEEIGGWPNVEPVARPSDFDTDRDGMPDAWEVAHGLDPNTADDKGDLDRDGYTNIEEYINEIAAFPSPTTLEFVAASGRFEEARNWSMSWQPSVYDTARIDAGTVTLDCPMQSARRLIVGAKGGKPAELKLNADVKMDIQLAGGALAVQKARIRGDLAMRSGVLRVAIESPERFSAVSIDGEAALGGRIEVSVGGGFQPQRGQRFEVLRAAKLSGRIASASPAFDVEQRDGTLALVAK